MTTEVRGFSSKHWYLSFSLSVVIPAVYHFCLIIKNWHKWAHLHPKYQGSEFISLKKIIIMTFLPWLLIFHLILCKAHSGCKESSLIQVLDLIFMEKWVYNLTVTDITRDNGYAWTCNIVFYHMYIRIPQKSRVFCIRSFDNKVRESSSSQREYTLYQYNGVHWPCRWDFSVQGDTVCCYITGFLCSLSMHVWCYMSLIYLVDISFFLSSLFRKYISK